METFIFGLAMVIEFFLFLKPIQHIDRGFNIFLTINNGD